MRQDPGKGIVGMCLVIENDTAASDRVVDFAFNQRVAALGLDCVPSVNGKSAVSARAVSTRSAGPPRFSSSSSSQTGIKWRRPLAPAP